MLADILTEMSAILWTLFLFVFEKRAIIVLTVSPNDYVPIVEVIQDFILAVIMLNILYREYAQHVFLENAL